MSNENAKAFLVDFFGSYIRCSRDFDYSNKHAVFMLDLIDLKSN